MHLPFGRYGELQIRYLAPLLPRVVGLAALLLGSIGLELINPQILRSFVDTATAGGEPTTLVRAALLFVGVTLVDQALWVGATYLGEHVGWTATNALREDLARHCLDLDLSFHHAHPPGELIERVDGDVTTLASFFSQLVVLVANSGLLLLGILVVLFREDWRVGLGFTVFVVGALVVLRSTRGLAVPSLQAERQASALLFGFLEERLAGIPDIQANGGRAHAIRQLQQHLRELFDRGRVAALVGGATFGITTVLFALGSAIAFALGATLFRAGVLTIGTVYLIFAYTELLRWPLEQLSRQVQDLQRASASLNRITALQAHAPSIVAGGDASLPNGPLAVAFENVTFAYGDREAALRDVSFSLEPGRTLGVLGTTGSGKSTLARLALRLDDPTTGTIRLGGGDVRAIPLAELRRRVGMVTQEVQLFRASLRDNVTLFDSVAATDERIVAALRRLGLGPWYDALPSGLETRLGAGGRGVSAGEAQLVALARAFLRDPGLVILDEASSRLDSATERLIEGAVDILLRGRTAIVIAHRLATLQRADELVLLDEGRVVERGPREELAMDPTSRYHHLLRIGLAEVLA